MTQVYDALGEKYLAPRPGLEPDALPIFRLGALGCGCPFMGTFRADVHVSVFVGEFRTALLALG